MKVSEKGLAFIAGHEGFVTRAYLDPAGIVTIGYGFTMRSRVFAAYWLARAGRKLKLGDLISRTDADKVLARLLEEEYGAAVREAFPGGLPQPQFDAVASVAYNLGPRALKWKWAAALKRGDIKTAARLLKKSGVTASGIFLEGLVNRRANEAALLETGEYGLGHVKAPGSSKDDVREAQAGLKRLGFDPGMIDGWAGRKTKAAVIAYQQQHPDLIADGIIGPATLAQIRADLTSLKGPVSQVAAAVTAASSSGSFLGLPWSWVIGIGTVSLVAVGGVVAWRNRGAIRRLFAGRAA